VGPFVQNKDCGISATYADSKGEKMICQKCKGNVIGLWEIERNGEKIQYKKCVNCGDVDFMNGTHDLKRLKKFNEKVSEKVKATATRSFFDVPDPMSPH
jgi:ribosomal protein S27AE